MTQGMMAGFMGYPESAKRRWLIQFVQAFTRESALLERFAPRGMTRT